MYLEYPEYSEYPEYPDNPECPEYREYPDYPEYPETLAEYPEYPEYLEYPDYASSALCEFISSDRSSCTDDGLLYIYISIRPLFQILSIYAFLYCYKCHSKSLKQYQCN